MGGEGFKLFFYYPLPGSSLEIQVGDSIDLTKNDLYPMGGESINISHLKCLLSHNEIMQWNVNWKYLLDYDHN
jgi:hypothetical protein